MLLRLKDNLVPHVNTKRVSADVSARSGTQGFELNSSMKGDILNQLILL